MSRWSPDGRRRLQDAALELFAEHGYAATTVIRDFLDKHGEGVHHLAFDCNGAPWKNRLAMFEERGFPVPIPAGAHATDMGKTGYLFAPSFCATSICRLVVALHGCQQTAE